MSNEKNDQKPANVAEAGAAELNEAQLDAVSGGYLKIEGIDGESVVGQIPGGQDVSIQQASGKRIHKP